MGWLVLGSRPAVEYAACGVTQKRYGNRARSRNVLRVRRWQRGSTETEVPALMKVLIGVDPHKASVAVAAVDEAKGELLERASFPQNRAGLRSLERWAKRFSERRWAVENAGGLGRQRPQERWARCPRDRAGRLAQRAAGGGRCRDWLGGASTPFREARGPGGRGHPGPPQKAIGFGGAARRPDAG